MTQQEVRRDLLRILIVLMVVAIAAPVVSTVVNNHNTKRAIAEVHRVDKATLARQQKSDRDAIERARREAVITANRLAYSTAVIDFKTCTRLNTVESKVLTYIDRVTDNAKRSAVATFQSPSSTLLMKQTVFRNLVGTLIQQVVIHNAFELQTCMPPPVTLNGQHARSRRAR